MKKEELMRQLKSGLIVSCQALRGEPLYSESGGVMPLMAKAAQKAGACGIRANSVRDILEIKKAVNLPIIGIIKNDYPPCDQYITVTMKEVDALVECKTDIIALDCTLRKRVDQKTPAEFIAEIKDKYPDQPLMADISTYAEGIKAAEAGVDFVSTTLCGYTPVTAYESVNGPSFFLVKHLCENTDCPIIAEGRIHYPWEARKMLRLGAFAVVVGGAITRPLEITQRFIDGMK
jgi:N-acylglucosamine-6-phosphate 2-epimerase